MMTIQGSPRPQAEIEQMLTEICADLIVAIREGMTLNGAPQPSTLAFVISAAGDLCATTGRERTCVLPRRMDHR
jgi:hypothetical protein